MAKKKAEIKQPYAKVTVLIGVSSSGETSTMHRIWEWNRTGKNAGSFTAPSQADIEREIADMKYDVGNDNHMVVHRYDVELPIPKEPEPQSHDIDEEAKTKLEYRWTPVEKAPAKPTKKKGKK